MDTISESTAFERGIDSVLQLVLPDKAAQVATLEGDRMLRARIKELAEKSTSDELTPGERAEYAGYVRANKFIAVLQRRARQILSDRP
jgi:hypothetical protein